MIQKGDSRCHLFIVYSGKIHVEIGKRQSFFYLHNRRNPYFKPFNNFVTYF